MKQNIADLATSCDMFKFNRAALLLQAKLAYAQADAAGLFNIEQIDKASTSVSREDLECESRRSNVSRVEKILGGIN